MRLHRLLLAVSLLLVGQPLLADEPAEQRAVSLKPTVSLIIDDLGDRLNDGLRAIALPGEVTYAILPRTTFSEQFAEMAHSRGKEIMLHQPMQAMNGKAMGPGGLSLHMTHESFLKTLRANIDSLPHARGINNHMGSLLTRHPGQMAWLMNELQQRGDLFFIDSGTSAQSVAQKVALEHELPTSRRNIFLDHVRTDTEIRKQFQRMIGQARAVGSVLAIAGAMAITYRSGETVVIGAVLALIGSLGWALQSLLVKRHVAVIDKLDLLLVRSVTMCVGVLGLSSVTGGLVWPGAWLIPASVVLSWFGFVMINLLIYHALNYTNVGKVSVLSVIEPPTVMLGAFLFLGDVPATMQLAGGVLILVGVSIILMQPILLSQIIPSTLVL